MDKRLILSWAIRQFVGVCPTTRHLRGRRRAEEGLSRRHGRRLAEVEVPFREAEVLFREVRGPFREARVVVCRREVQAVFRP